MPTIKRWGLMHCYKEENISEHSHQVSIIAHLLGVINNEIFAGSIIPERAATVAIYHEMSEIYGDLATPVKYANPEMTAAYKKIEAMAEQQCVDTLPFLLQSAYQNLVVQKDVDPEYKRIVKYADIIAAYVKAKDEVHHGNPEFKEALGSIEEKIISIAEESREVKYFVETFLPACVASLDTLANPDR